MSSSFLGSDVMMMTKKASKDSASSPPPPPGRYKAPLPDARRRESALLLVHLWTPRPGLAAALRPRSPPASSRQAPACSLRMCRGLAALPAACLERAKEFKTRLGILLHKPDFGYKFSWGTKERYSAEEVLGWNESFDYLMRSKSGVAAFHGFLKTEFSEENLDFWLACEDYKKTRSKAKLAAKAKKIFEDFVQNEAPREVNLDHETREATRRNLTAVATSGCFEEAQAKTYTLMEKDSYPRFLKSAYYRDLTEQAASHRTGKAAHT